MLEDEFFVCANLGKHTLFVWLFVSSIKTGKRSVIHRSSRTTEDSSSRMITRLVSVFIPEANNACFPKFVQMDNASSRLKKALHFNAWQFECVNFMYVHRICRNISDVTMTQTFLLHGMSIVELISPYKVVTHNYCGGPACRYTKMSHGFTCKEFSNRWSQHSATITMSTHKKVTLRLLHAKYARTTFIHELSSIDQKNKQASKRSERVSLYNTYQIVNKNHTKHFPCRDVFLS